MIEPDDTIIIRYPRSEMGQGSFTALPMIVAEELECDWSKVKAEFASANRNLRQNFVYGKDMSSVGSHSVAVLARADAAGRRLSARAAGTGRGQALGGARSRSARPSSARSSTSRSGRSLGYGALAADAAKITPDKEPAIKTPEQYTLVGTPKPRLDMPLKINGTAALRHRHQGAGHGLCRGHRAVRSRAAR